MDGMILPNLFLFLFSRYFHGYNKIVKYFLSVFLYNFINQISLNKRA